MASPEGFFAGDPGSVSEGDAMFDSQSRALAGVALLVGLSLTGCEPAPRVGAELPPVPGGETATFSGIVENVLVPRCATSACHSSPQAGIPPPAFPALDPDVAYEQLVNASSGQAPLDLVAPGDPDNSYLLQKLQGTGSMMLMPTDGKLDDATIEAIAAWIRNGAPND
jgi:hypothetical protein